MKKILVILMITLAMIGCGNRSMEYGISKDAVEIKSKDGNYAMHIAKDYNVYIVSNNSKEIYIYDGYDYSDVTLVTDFSKEDNYIFDVRDTVFEESKASKNWRKEAAKEWADNMYILTGEKVKSDRRKMFEDSLEQEGTTYVFGLECQDVIAMSVWEMKESKEVILKDKNFIIKFDMAKSKKKIEKFLGDKFKEDVKADRELLDIVENIKKRMEELEIYYYPANGSSGNTYGYFIKNKEDEEDVVSTAAVTPWSYSKEEYLETVQSTKDQFKEARIEYKVILDQWNSFIISYEEEKRFHMIYKSEDNIIAINILGKDIEAATRRASDRSYEGRYEIDKAYRYLEKILAQKGKHKKYIGIQY
jgi:hypothetical protein